MIIANKNEGEKIPYEQNGNKVCFDDDLTINLAKREEDEAVHIDICYDGDGALVVGAAAGRRYVAEIDMPAREYTETEEETEEGAPKHAGTLFRLIWTRLLLPSGLCERSS